MKTYLHLLFGFLFLLSTPLCGQNVETSIQYGHHLPVSCVRYSPDGEVIASGSRDKSIKLWEVSTGRELRTLSRHEATVRAIDFSPNGKTLLSGGNDAQLLFWDIYTGKLIKNLEGHDRRITHVKFSPSGKLFVSGGYDGFAILWDADSLKILQKIKVNPATGTGEGVHFAFSPDEKKLAIGQDNYSTILWDIKSNAITDTLRYNDGGWCGGCPNWSVFSEDNKYLYTISNKKGIFKWELKKGTLVKKKLSEDEYVGISNDPVSNKWGLAQEKSIHLYDQDLSLINTIEANNTLFNALDINKNIIATGTDMNTIESYSFTGKQHHSYRGLTQEKSDDGLNYDINSLWDSYIINYILTKPCMELSPDEQFLLVGKIGKKARLLEFKTGKIVNEFEGHAKTVLSAAFSPDGQQLLTGGGDGKIMIWDVHTSDSLLSFEAHRDAIFDLDFDKEGKRFISSSWDGTLRMWDATTGERIKNYYFENASPFKAEFVLNDFYILVAMLDGSLRLLEPDTGEEVKRYIGHSNKIHDFSIKNDELMFVSASWDGLIKEWDLVDALQTKRLSNGSQKKYAVAYSANQQFIASGGEDRNITLWNTKNNEITHTLSGHEAAVNAITITNDSRYLISGSVNGTIKLWDLKKQQELYTYYTIGHKDWLVKTPQGYFDGTKNAQNYIFFIQGLKSYSIDQFFDDFYKPGLVNDLFASSNIPPAQYNLTERLEAFPPPSIEIVSPEAGKQPGLGELELWVKAHDTGGGIDEVKVMHNGKRIPTKSEKGLHRTPHKGNVVNKTFTLTLVPGVNTIQVSAFSDGRVESQPIVLNFPIASEQKKGNCHVLVLGINKYQNPALNLNYAREDAKSVVKMVKQHSEALFEEVIVHELYDEEATRENIVAKLSTIAASANPEDVFLFFYAGHGSLIDREFFFIPTEVTRLYEGSTLQQKALSAELVQGLFSEIKALKQVVVIDACHSGASTEVLAQRGGLEEKAIAQLSRSAGVHVMASTGSEQFATEFKELGHGVFTYSLLSALEGKADGAPKDGRVTIFEMKSYLDSVVPDLSESKKGKAQYPYTFSVGNDFPLTVPKP